MVTDIISMKSIIGRLLGISFGGHLTGDGFKGMAIGHRGANYIFGAPPDKIELYDSFLGKTLSTRWASHQGSDGGVVAFGITPNNDGDLRGTTGAGAGATMAVNGVQLDSALNWRASDGALVCEWVVKPSSAATICIFIGLTNQITSLQMPGTISGGTLTANAADMVGFLYDTAATASTIKLVGSANSVLPAIQDTGVAIDTTAFHIYRLTLDTAGNATFFIDGNQVGVPATAGQVPTMPLAVTPTVTLTPVVAAFTRAAGSANIDIDWAWIQQNT